MQENKSHGTLGEREREGDSERGVLEVGYSVTAQQHCASCPRPVLRSPAHVKKLHCVECLGGSVG